MCEGDMKMDGTLPTVIDLSGGSCGGGEEESESFSSHREDYELLDASSSSIKFRPSSMDASNMSTLSTVSSSGTQSVRLRAISEQSHHMSSPPPSSPARHRLKKGCMIVRTHEESLDPSECEAAKKMRRRYLSRRGIDTTSSSSSSSSTTTARSVRFETMTVNWHPMIMGDNPSGTTGPPLTIDWDPVDTSECMIDDYERTKQGNNNNKNSSNSGRRTMGEMVMPSEYRFEYLVHGAGMKKKEIMQNIRMVQRCKIQRAETRRTFYMFKSDERREIMYRRFKNLILSGKKKKERQFLAMSKEIHELQRCEADRAAIEARRVIEISAQEPDHDDDDGPPDEDIDICASEQWSSQVKAY